MGARFCGSVTLDPGANKKVIRLVIVVSTAGSVMNQLLHNPFFKSRVHAVVSDRECPAIAKADLHGVATVIFPDSDKEKFSESVRQYLRSEKADYAISFYSKLFVY